jgi:putative Mg2+ transporter-C (MgtC) family protein
MIGLADVTADVAAWYGDAVARDGEAILRLLIAVACGALVGWNRETHEKAAGLRTHILLALGACLFTVVGARMAGDSNRLLQGMVTGTGFLAAGVIFREGASVHGLTTAAGLWVMAAVGMTIGLGEYFLGVLATIVMFLILTFLREVEVRLRARMKRDGAAAGDAAGAAPGSAAGAGAESPAGEKSASAGQGGGASRDDRAGEL